MDVENLAKELILKNMTPEQQMAVLDSVRQSVSQAKEVQKRKIGENVDLVVQALKKIESDITTRFESVGNSIEKRVLSIKDGRDGANGKDGRDGKDGKSGKDGLKGDRGVDGQAGRDGVDGVDGISVVNANIDFDGSLIISLSDGREINVGEVVSADVAEKIKVISTMSTNGAVGIKDEGTSISTGVKNINFVGAAVTATNSGDDVTVNVSSGTGTVTSVAATAGTGISVSGSPITTTGTLTITNTAPDQTVSLTASTGISTSGTYPSFTITNTAPDQTVVLTAGTGINTSGTYPNFTITNTSPSLGGDVVGPASATDNAVARYNLTTGKLIQNSGVIIDDSNNVTGVNTLTATNIIVNDDTTLGGSNADSLAVNARITTDLEPATNNAKDIGTNGRNWRDGFFGRNLGTVNLSVTGTTSFDGSQGTSGQVLTSAGTGNTPTWTTPTTGTVTSVTGTAPVVSSGGATPDISLSANYGDTLNPYASKTANFVLASPSASAGVPSFRALVAADVPTLNQNTTGTAASTPKLLTTNFTIEESGGKLLFKYGATTIASMSSTGIITSATNIVANGTP